MLARENSIKSNGHHFQTQLKDAQCPALERIWLEKGFGNGTSVSFLCITWLNNSILFLLILSGYLFYCILLMNCTQYFSEQMTMCSAFLRPVDLHHFHAELHKGRLVKGRELGHVDCRWTKVASLCILFHLGVTCIHFCETRNLHMQNIHMGDSLKCL